MTDDTEKWDLTVTLTVAKGLSQAQRERTVDALTSYAHSMMFVRDAEVGIAEPEGGRDSDPSPVSYAPCIQGVIEIGERKSEFLIPLDPASSTQYSQWGADNPTLWSRTDLVEVMASAAREWAEENLCSVCKERTLDDGEGYEGMCGNCADKSTCVADCSPDDEDLDGPCSECGTDWSKWNGEDHEQFRYEQREEREQANAREE